MKTALMLLQLIPAILSIIPSLNQFLPQSGQGAVKLELLKTILTEAYAGINSIWPVIEKIVAALCSAKKAADTTVIQDTTTTTTTTITL